MIKKLILSTALISQIGFVPESANSAQIGYTFGRWMNGLPSRSVMRPEEWAICTLIFPVLPFCILDGAKSDVMTPESLHSLLIENGYSASTAAQVSLETLAFAQALGQKSLVAKIEASDTADDLLNVAHGISKMSRETAEILVQLSH